MNNQTSSARDDPLDLDNLGPAVSSARDLPSASSQDKLEINTELEVHQNA